MRNSLIHFARRIYHWLAGDPLEHMSRSGLKVGRNVHIMDDVIIDHNHFWHISIGDDVTIAPRAYILAHDASTKRALGYARIGRVNIGSRVFIGAGAIILPGVTIGDDVVIGAGSVVTGNIPSNSVAVGNPACVVGTCDAYLEKRSAEMQSVPCFGPEYTTVQNVSDAMKNEMNEKMTTGIGYVV